jgi:hypothetical protein
MQYQDQGGAGAPPQPNQVPNPNNVYNPNHVAPVGQPYGYQAPAQPYGAPVAAPVPGGYVAPQPAAPMHGGNVPLRDSQKIPDRKSIASKLIELTYLLLIILESALALRFAFKLLNADPRNILVRILYGATSGFTLPFEGLFRSNLQNEIQVSGYSLEFTTLIAMGVYALLVYIIVRIIDIFR